MPGIKVGGESPLQIHRTGGSVSGPDPFFDCEGEYQGEGAGPRNSARDSGGCQWCCSLDWGVGIGVEGLGF